MEITPHTKVLDMLNVYPQLEETLFSISPTFSKLKNPILRNTVAKIATIQHAAKISEIPLHQLLNTLRKAAGLDEFFVPTENNLSTTKPKWLLSNKVVCSLDVTQQIDEGNSPMQFIIKHVEDLKENEILEFITPFYPAPIIEIIQNKKYTVFSENSKHGIINYVCNLIQS